MSAIYLDTSALMKRYLDETGSAWLEAWLEKDPSVACLTSHLSMIEGVCTLNRRRREGQISAADYAQVLSIFDHDFRYRYDLITIKPIVIDTARQLAERNPLRAYDAMQLASAWLVNHQLVDAGRSPLTFLCADDRLNLIAQKEGLHAENPNHHP